MLLYLEQHEIICSSGSACAAGADRPSHVLLAMGVEPEVAQTAVRFTLSEGTTADELSVVAQTIRDAIHSLTRGA